LEFFLRKAFNEKEMELNPIEIPIEIKSDLIQPGLQIKTDNHINEKPASIEKKSIKSFNQEYLTSLRRMLARHMKLKMDLKPTRI
jgi:hypothetical protein